MVAVFGTTGVQTKIHKYTIDAIKNAKKAVGGKLPIGIGFGVSTPADVKKYVSVGVDAVIVGSANLKIIENTPSSKLQKRITEYTKKLKRSTRI
jgi:tryptophan synthase alpha chain